METDKKLMREKSDGFLKYLEGKACCENPEPMVLGGTIMRELGLSRDDFFTIVGQLMEFNRISVVEEGTRKYYLHMGMIDAFRERLNKR